jgi:GT2 family glycosyltransferase
MDLSIIIVNWNSADYVKACIKSLYAGTEGLDYEILVVDNGSFDVCRTMIAAEFPGVVFMQSDYNLGFARANNFGAEKAKGEYLLFLNPDTQMINNAVGELLAIMRRLPRAGVVGCKLLNTDLTVQTSCIQPFPTILNQVLDAEILQRLFPGLRLWGTGPLTTGRQGPAEVQVVSGAGMMIRSAVFKEVGGFSSEYFMYTEDIDLCYKVQRAGYINYYTGSVSIIHHGGGSSLHRKESAYANIQMRESVLKFLKKTRGSFYALVYKRSLLLSGIIRLILTFLMLIPCTLVGRYSSCMTSLNKWINIIRWSLGIVDWVR